MRLLLRGQLRARQARFADEVEALNNRRYRAKDIGRAIIGNLNPDGYLRGLEAKLNQSGLLS